MGFLDWIADWAEDNIPMVGTYIATLVRNIQWGVEAAYDYIKWIAEYLYDRYWEWIRPTLQWVENQVTHVLNYVMEFVQPRLEWLQGSLEWLSNYILDYVTEMILWLSDVASDLSNTIETWIKPKIDWLTNALTSFQEWVNQQIASFSAWIANSVNWLWNQLQNAKDRLWGLIEPYVKPTIDKVTQIERQLSSFLKDPKGYIEDVTKPLLQPLKLALDDFSRWVTDTFNNIRSGVLYINEWLYEKLEEFIWSVGYYLFWSFFDDLRTLKWDVKNKTIIGEPKHPVTRFLIYVIEIEKPKYDYESVEEEVSG